MTLGYDRWVENRVSWHKLRGSERREMECWDLQNGQKYEELFLAAGVPSSSWCASGRQIMSICPCPWPWAVVYLAAAYTRRTAETHSQTMLLLWGSMFILSLVLGLAIFIKFLLLGYA